MKNYKSIQVICPGGGVTGGTEAFHQLVEAMRELNLPAYIVYEPFEQCF